MSVSVEAAFLERVAASPLKAFDAPPPASTAYPYVALYFDGGPESSERETDSLERRTYAVQSVVVGSSVAQVRAARERLIAAVAGWVPSVAGRLCSRVEREGSQLVRPDPELPDRTVFIATDQWQVVSDPA